VKKDFGYQWEKMSQAVRALMAPHPEGEEQAFGYARHACQLGMDAFDPGVVTDPDAKKWIQIVIYAMETKPMTYEQRLEFSDAVYELAIWFRRQLDEYYE
jgi:hypothetical protein